MPNICPDFHLLDPRFLSVLPTEVLGRKTAKGFIPFRYYGFCLVAEKRHPGERVLRPACFTGQDHYTYFGDLGAVGEMLRSVERHQTGPETVSAAFILTADSKRLFNMVVVRRADNACFVLPAALADVFLRTANNLPEEAQLDRRTVTAQGPALFNRIGLLFGCAPQNEKGSL